MLEIIFAIYVLIALVIGIGLTIAAKSVNNSPPNILLFAVGVIWPLWLVLYIIELVKRRLS